MGAIAYTPRPWIFELRAATSGDDRDRSVFGGLLAIYVDADFDFEDEVPRAESRRFCFGHDVKLDREVKYCDSCRGRSREVTLRWAL